MERYLANFYIALNAIMANKIRSVLTALGIIFGVGAVIAMLAVGNGAQQEILNQIKLVGVNNIIVSPIIEQKEEKVEEESTKMEKHKFSPGLNMADAKSIQEILTNIEQISPEILIETFIIKDGKRRSAKLVGVEPTYFSIANFELKEGSMFSEYQLNHGAEVCIIGRNVQTKFFTKEAPIGKQIKVGSRWLRVIGVLEERYVSQSSDSKLGIRDYNMDVYIPIRTMLLKYTNRSLVTERMIERASQEQNNGQSPDAPSPPKKNYNQLDRLVIQVNRTEHLNTTSETISRMLQRRHNGLIDFEIVIPELLLKQQQKTKNIFNIVLGSIAGISLLVGGIGIMNIMLASVLERTKEIGLRLSIGAKKQDIILQFLTEAILISISGGIIGIILGVSIAYSISSISDIPTIISSFSILISFGVAATVGLIFGIAPARRAANQDPITSLRYE